mgnify:CR=1 FL=1
MQEIKDRAASLAGLALERDAIYLYDRLAALEKDPQRRAAFESIAASERRHAAIWEAKLISLRCRFYLRQTSLPRPSASNSPCGACCGEGTRERSHVPLEGWAERPVVKCRRRVIERKEGCPHRRLPRLSLERSAVSLRDLRLWGECAERVPPERRDDDRLQEGELTLKEP